MIRSFGNKAAEDIFNGDNTRDARELPPELTETAKELLDIIQAATSVNDLRSPPGMRLKKMKGRGRREPVRWSIRINDQWRIVFGWEGGDATDVEIGDYH